MIKRYLPRTCLYQRAERAPLLRIKKPFYCRRLRRIEHFAMKIMHDDDFALPPLGSSLRA